MQRPNQLLRRLIAPAVLAAAVAAPAAQASATPPTRPDDRGGIKGPGVTVVSGTIRPDDRSGIRGPGGRTAATVVVHADGSGFTWRVTAIGLVAAFGMGVAIVSLRRRNSPKAA